MLTSRYYYYYKHIILDTCILTQNVSTPMQLIKWEKIVLSSSTSTGQLAALTLGALEIVTGQKGKNVYAKKSIANYKLIQGDVTGCMVTLRRWRMFSYIDLYITLIKPEQLENYSAHQKTWLQGGLDMGKTNKRHITQYSKNNLFPKSKLIGFNLAMQSYFEYPELKPFFSQFSPLKGKHINMVLSGHNNHIAKTRILGF